MVIVGVDGVGIMELLVVVCEVVVVVKVVVGVVVVVVVVVAVVFVVVVGISVTITVRLCWFCFFTLLAWSVHCPSSTISSDIIVRLPFSDTT